MKLTKNSPCPFWGKVQYKSPIGESWSARLREVSVLWDEIWLYPKQLNKICFTEVFGEIKAFYAEQAVQEIYYYNKTSLNGTPSGTRPSVRFKEVSSYRGSPEFD